MELGCNFTLPGNVTPRGLGWFQSVHDFRDYSPVHPVVRKLLESLPVSGESERPTCADLREYFPEPQDQLRLNSSSVHATIALVEYFERRATGKSLEPSRLFLYYTTRRLMHITGDNGADMRSVFKAMQCFGMPPEEFWPYNVEKANHLPDAFLYSFAHDYRLMRYVRLDMRNSSGQRTLEIVRAFVAAGFPVAFGFPVPSSISTACDIPYRPTFDSVQGGQAVACVGYDDRRLAATRGALLVRNSWGTNWGDGGYGWLPYRYVEEQLAADFWTILHPKWLASDEFSRPRI